MAFQARYVYGGDWSGLFYASAERTFAEELRRDVYVRPAGRGYDGQQYRAIAHDPWPPFRLNFSLDSPAFRRQRMLVPSLAWCLALGRPEWIDSAYIAVVLLSAAAAVYFASAAFALRGWSAWWGGLALALPPVVTSVDRMGVDAALLAFGLAAAVLWERGRWGWMWVALALAALTRETGMLFAAGAGVALWRRGEWRRGAVILTAAAPALAWKAFLALRLSSPEPEIERWFLFDGLFHMLGRAEQGAGLPLRILNTAGLIGLTMSLAVAARWLWNGSVLGALVAFFVPLSLVLGAPQFLESPVAYGRIMGPLLAFVLFESILRRRWRWAAAVGAVCAGPIAYSLVALLRGLRLMPH
jgi:hypothetical protein